MIVSRLVGRRLLRLPLHPQPAAAPRYSLESAAQPERQLRHGFLEGTEPPPISSRMEYISPMAFERAGMSKLTHHITSQAWCCSCCDLIQQDKEAEHLMANAVGMEINTQPMKTEAMSYAPQ